jgi:hypothetical protein
MFTRTLDVVVPNIPTTLGRAPDGALNSATVPSAVQ